MIEVIWPLLLLAVGVWEISKLLSSSCLMFSKMRAALLWERVRWMASLLFPPRLTTSLLQSDTFNTWLSAQSDSSLLQQTESASPLSTITDPKGCPYYLTILCQPVVISVKLLLDVVPKLLESFPAAGVNGTCAVKNLVDSGVFSARRLDGLIRKFIFSGVSILDYLTFQLPLHKLTPI